jgi:hypothetical protein
MKIKLQGTTNFEIDKYNHLIKVLSDHKWWETQLVQDPLKKVEA